MKILILCRSMPWRLAGGLERHAWDLARGLARRGDETHILTTRADPASPPPPPPPNIVIHEIETGSPGEYSIGAFRAFARQAAALDCRHRFDVFHSQGFAAFAFPRSLSRRLAATIHGTLTSETPLHRDDFRAAPWSRKAWLLWRYKARLASYPLYRRLLGMSRVLLVDSEFTRRELIRPRPGLDRKIRVVPLGVHPDSAPPALERRPRAEGEPLRFLTVGRMTEAKGVDVALEALGRLPRSGWLWRAAGAGPALEALRARADALGLAGMAQFLGPLEDAALRRLYAESDLFIYPERGRPAFGLVGLEAQLAGLPVVASDRGAIPEVIRPDVGWIVPAENPAALAERLRSILEHPEELREKAARCRAAALRRFGYEAMIEGARAALREAARGEAGAPA